MNVNVRNFGADPGRVARRLRLDTLSRLRWLAVLGQSAAVLVSYYGLHLRLPLGFCCLAIAASAWLNMGLRLRYPVSQRLGDDAALALLAYDVAQLSSLLYLCGGLGNPFAMLLLAPLIISAMSLPLRRTLVLVLLMVVLATGLAFQHRHLPWFRGEALTLPNYYTFGIWIALVLSAAFVTIYATRVAQEARQLSDALAATELTLAREQHLSQLDGLAAAAAHELGTPLSTITLVVKDIAAQAPPGGPLAEDIALLVQETRRCRTILSKIASLGDDPPDMLERVSLGQLVDEVAGPHRAFGAAVHVETRGEGPEPIGRRNAGLIYGLGNLVENAADFAASRVDITASWTAGEVTIAIADDGPGFAPDIVARVGEPYVTTARAAQRRSKFEEGSGLGLGLFIAKTLLERSGARFSAGNAAAPQTGARVQLVWSRAAFEHFAPAIASAERRFERIA